MFCYHQKGGDCWTLVDFDDTKTLMLCLLIKLNKCLHDENKYTLANLHKWTLRTIFLVFIFESLSVRFEPLNVRFESVKVNHQNWSLSKNEKNNSNPLKKDLNSISKEFRLKKVIRIRQKMIRISIPKYASWKVWEPRFESPWRGFKSWFQ